MKSFYTMLIILISAHSYSQNCEYQKNEIDEFTNEQTVITKEQLFAQGMADKLRVFGFRIGDSDINLVIQYSRYGIFSVEKGARFMFLLSNGEMVELVCQRTVVAEPLGSGVGTNGVWVGKMEYIVSEDQAQRLMASALTKIRMYIREGYVEKKVKRKGSDDLRQIVRCLENS